MLHGFRNLTLPPLKHIQHLEGKGNWAVRKYYKWPHKIFYQKKLCMILDLLGANTYHNILDYGAGPGILAPELKKRCLFLRQYEPGQTFDRRWRFNVIILGSVLEFLPHLDATLVQLKNILKPGGFIVAASPMETPMTRAYFKLINDTYKRHSHVDIIHAVNHHFKIDEYRTWMGLYFALSARPA